MDDALNIRKGEARDLEVIVDFNINMAIETESKHLDRATTTRGVEAALRDEAKGLYFLADLDGRVIGQLMLTHEWSDWRNGDIWWIQSVYVMPDFRGRGIFGAMYRFVAAEAKKTAAIGLRLYIERDNAGARKVYEKLGMTLTHYDIMEEMF